MNESHRTVKIILFAAGVLLASGLFAQSPNSDVNGDGNRKYLPNGILDYGESNAREALNDFAALHPSLRVMAPPESRFDFDVATGGIFDGERGTRLVVPPNAFVTEAGQPVRGQVSIRLREVIDAFDFATAPIGLEYNENGQRSWFQSGGMFHISAAKGDQALILAPQQKIVVAVPAVQPGDFKVYNTNQSGEWVYRGEEATRNPANPANPAESETGNGDPTGAEMVFEGEVSLVAARIFAIDGMSWWNFDQPYPHVACVQGKISDPQKIFTGRFQVLSIGVDYRGSFNRWDSGTQFRINVHRDRAAKILIIDEKNNVGVSAVIDTPKRSGFDKDPDGPNNYCEQIAEISIQPVDADLLKDKAAFMQFIGLPREYYQVQYGPESLTPANP